MKKMFFKITFFIAVFIFSLFIENSFAEHAEFKAIKELEQIEKTPHPESIIRPKVEYKAGDLRDPFQEPQSSSVKKSEVSVTEATSEKPLPTLIVQGLIWGGRFPQAIINNKVVKLGDTIEGVNVINIDKDGVTVYFEGIQHRLPSPAASAQPYLKP